MTARRWNWPAGLNDPHLFDVLKGAGVAASILELSWPPVAAADSNTAERERAVLCALFQQFDDLTFRREAIASLREYRFSLPELQCIFDALCRIAHRAGVPLELQLVQRLTTMGFPDVDLGFLQDTLQDAPNRFRDALRRLVSN